jgi:predicted ATPase
LVNYILDFLKEADFNITNIDTDTITRSLSEDGLKYVLENDRIPNEEKERIKAERTLKRIKTTFEHTVEGESGSKAFQFSTNEESVGTLRTIGIETALYNAIRSGAFLPIDEIETSLHPKLMEKILYEYLRTPSRSQVLIATHNDGLLDLVNDLIRKDSIWFTEKDGAGVTELYKLTDFRGVNRLTSIREAYRNKRFGATMGNGK